MKYRSLHQVYAFCAVIPPTIFFALVSLHCASGGADDACGGGACAPPPQSSVDQGSGGSDGSTSSAGGGGGAPMQCPLYKGDCNDDPSDGCEVDLYQDPRNCGACDIDCGGGECIAAECQPWVIASNQQGPWQLALDHKDLFFTTLGTKDVRRVSTEGGADAIVAAEMPPTYPNALAVGAQHVCFATYLYGSPSNVRCATADGQTIVTVATDIVTDAASTALMTPRLAIHEESEQVFFSVRHADNGGGLYRAPLDGSTGATLVPGTQANPIGVATDGAHIYAALSGTLAGGFQDGSIVRLDAAGTGLVTLAQWLSLPTTIAVDGGYVYFHTIEGPSFGSIWRLSASTPSTPTLVVDTTNLSWGAIYEWTVGRGQILWTTFYLDKIMKYDPMTATEVELAHDPLDPFGIAADESFVYWAGYYSNASVRAIRY